MANFGASFRRAREAAGLPLERIAAETRISTRFLLAIESEDFHVLPGGVFNRGFVRAYAVHLGLDPDQAVTEYSRLSATSDEPLEALRESERASSRKAERSLFPLLAAILVVLIGAYYFVNRGSTSQTADTAATATPSEVATTAPPALPATSTEAADVPVQTPPKGAAINPAPAAVAPATEAKPTASSPFATGALVLEVDVKELTWIRIATDGTVALNETIAAGTVRRFSAEHSIDIVLGNAGGAKMRINGRDMGQLGARGQVREFKITPENALRIQG